MKALVVALMLLLGAGSAIACSCLPPGPPKDHLALVDVVFAGTADSVRYLTDTTSVLGTRYEVNGDVEVRFRLRASWKGVRSDTILVVKTPSNSGACGFHFEARQDYVVYAWYDSLRQGYRTGLCSRTCGGDKAKAEWGLLGPPKWGPWRVWGAWNLQQSR